MSELEFSKMLVPRLPQNLSNVNIECAGKSKQRYSIYSLRDQLLGAMIYVHFIVLILICFQLIIPAGNYAIYGCSSSRTTSGVISIQELHTGGKYFAVITQDRVIDDHFNSQVKKLCLLVDYSY